MQNKSHTDHIWLIAAMCIFGSIGLFRKFIDLPSSIIALARALIGTVSLLIPLLAKRKEQDLSAVWKNALLLLLKGDTQAIKEAMNIKGDETIVMDFAQSFAGGSKNAFFNITEP